MFLFSAILLATGAASPVEDVARLESRAAEKLGVAVAEPGGMARPLDRRIRLASCPVAADIAVSERQVRFACPAKGWQFTVPRIAEAGSAEQAVMVRRGQPVTVRMTGPGFTVLRSGIVQQDAALGASVAVRLDSKSPPVGAVVSGPSEVRINSR